MTFDELKVFISDLRIEYSRKFDHQEDDYTKGFLFACDKILAKIEDRLPSTMYQLPVELESRQDHE